MTRRPSTLRIVRLNEDVIEFFLNDVELGSADYDQHGSAGMHLAEQLMTSLARELNLKVEKTEE